MPRTTLSADLARSVLELIHADGLVPGDRLPAVKSLADQHDVAPSTMREALRALEANGIIEIRHGTGVFVRDSGQRVVLANPALTPPDKTMILELLDSRLLIEPYLASRAAERMTDAGLKQLEKVLRAAERHLDDDEQLAPLNMDFHLEIARVSEHRTLCQVLETLVDLYAHTQGVILVIHGDRARDHRQHRDILDALRSRDPETARRAMHQHLSDVLAVVTAHLQDD